MAVSGALNAQHRGRLQLNRTQSDGFREEADYQRFSSSLRLDSDFTPQLQLKTLASFGSIDQSGTSGLNQADFTSNPIKPASPPMRSCNGLPLRNGS